MSIINISFNFISSKSKIHVPQAIKKQICKQQKQYYLKINPRHYRIVKSRNKS